MDHRIVGVLLPAVEQQRTTLENKVKKWIEKCENDKHKESFVQYLRHTEKINKFSKESHDLIADLNAVRQNRVGEAHLRRQAKRECTQFYDEHLARTQEEYKPFLAVNK